MLLFHARTLDLGLSIVEEVPLEVGDHDPLILGKDDPCNEAQSLQVFRDGCDVQLLIDFSLRQFKERDLPQLMVAQLTAAACVLFQYANKFVQNSVGKLPPSRELPDYFLDDLLLDGILTLLLNVVGEWGVVVVAEA